MSKLIQNPIPIWDHIFSASHSCCLSAGVTWQEEQQSTCIQSIAASEKMLGLDTMYFFGYMQIYIRIKKQTKNILWNCFDFQYWHPKVLSSSCIDTRKGKETQHLYRCVLCACTNVTRMSDILEATGLCREGGEIRRHRHHNFSGVHVLKFFWQRSYSKGIYFSGLQWQSFLKKQNAFWRTEKKSGFFDKKYFLFQMK